MKKVLLTAMALLTIASTSAFGYYGANSDWIDFLVDANQFRARLRQIGFVLGNDTIRGVFGFRAENSKWGSLAIDDTIHPIDELNSKNYLNFTPTLSAGIGYTSDAFSIGVGYNYNYKHDTLRNIFGQGNFTKNGVGLSVHTPVVTLTAMQDSLRLAIPIQVAVKNGDITESDRPGSPTDDTKYLGVSLDPQIRYYTGIDAFNEVRLYVKYGMNEFSSTDGDKFTVSSFGFDFRAYFGATVGDVALKPFLKVVYNTLLDAKGKNVYNISGATAEELMVNNVTGISAGSGYVAFESPDGYVSNPWDLEILPTLGLSANSDIVSVYVEAGLGYKTWNDGRSTDSKYAQHHGLRWNAYGEIYITPVKDLEWYFEAEIGNPANSIYSTASGNDSIVFNNSTGITWYLPSFGAGE